MNSEVPAQYNPQGFSRTQLLMMVKEVREELDAKKAAELVQTERWIITLAALQANGDILWVLMRLW